MKKIILSFLLLSSLFSFGQGDQTIITIPGVEPAILHLPVGYGTGTTTYPLLVFLHGKGEGGINPATIYTNSVAGGPAYFIAQGRFPSSIPFIVVSPQFPNTTSGTSAQMLDSILHYMINNYRVDVSRICLTGLSEGAMAVVNYITHYQVIPTVNISSCVIMSANIGQPSQAMINQIVTSKINVWGFGAMTDGLGIQTRVLIQGAFGGNGGTLVGIGSLGKFTSYVCGTSSGHGCWGTYYDPTYTENGLNIYQWMLQFSVGGNVIPPVIIPPVVVDSAGIIKAYLTTHPCPLVDTIAIGKGYLLSHPCPVCPPPVICPVCPPQRNVVRFVNDFVGKTCYFIFSDSTTQVLLK